MMTFAMIAAAWPLVTMRQMSATTFAPSNLNALVEIHARHRGAVDEFWLADGTPRRLPELEARARQVGEGAAALARAGLVNGFQQGVTLGHGFTEWDENAWTLPDDAWGADHDGKRTGFLCPRSPAVQAMAEAYAEAYVRFGKVRSYWLDDDLRFGFYKGPRAESCWCPRCLQALNVAAGTTLSREEAVARLSSAEPRDPLRAVWARVRAEGLAAFAAASARGARRADPEVRMGYQAISSATICSGEDNRAVLEALSDGGQHPVGIRPGHGFYNEDCDVKRELAAKVLDAAREAERCRALPWWKGSVVYEQETWPHHVMQKTMGAVVKEAAVALAAGCDAVALYWYSAAKPEPVSYYEELVENVARWRPYWRRLSDIAKGTHLGGVSLAADPDLMTGPKAAIPQVESLVRRDPSEVELALMGVPVTVAEAGGANHFDPAWVPKRGAYYLDRDRVALLDRLDRGEPGGVAVRVDKIHPLLVYPRVDAAGRTVAVTFVNVSVGTARALPVRIRRPAGTRLQLVRPDAEDRLLNAAMGSSDEFWLTLPDLGAWEMMTVICSR